jgi:hypothetical protein
MNFMSDIERNCKMIVLGLSNHVQRQGAGSAEGGTYESNPYVEAR